MTVFINAFVLYNIMYYIYYDIIDEFRVLISWRPNDVLFFKKNFNVLRLDGVGGGVGKFSNKNTYPPR